MLPRLQGNAGEFVYGQLSHQTRTNYKELVQEINSRFRIVETRKTFQVQFSKRSHKHGESVEEYAAELKRLYDKAYKDRGHNTRREDLLRRFLDGLMDGHAKFHVEYVKEPDNIDQAVYEVVNFSEMKHNPVNKEYSSDYKQKRPTRAVKYHGEIDVTDHMVRPSDDDSDQEEEHDDRIARMPAKTNKSRPITRAMDKPDHGTTPDNKASPTQQVSRENNPPNNADSLPTHHAPNSNTNELTKILQSMETRMANLETHCKQPIQLSTTRPAFDSNRRRQPQSSLNSRQGQPPRGYQQQTLPTKRPSDYWSTVCCYHCNQNGHIKRNCPNGPWVTGQVQLAVQPGCSPMPTLVNDGVSAQLSTQPIRHTSGAPNNPLNC